MHDIINRIKRGIRKPPKVILKRALAEFRIITEQYFAPQRAKAFNLTALLKATCSKNMDELWLSLAQRPFPAYIKQIDPQEYEQLCPQSQKNILAKAAQAMRHEVNLLGSGPVVLGTKIDWHKDYKSGFSWPSTYARSIDYNNPDRPSDVKFPWELSRMQWLIAVGQAYLLTNDEKYAYAVKNILENWIDNNPYAYSVNWACTMEVALRIFTWTWFFHVFHKSKTWNDNLFREKFLRMLFLHGDFTERNLEYSDINGNHYTADAAGLVFVGLFFGKGTAAQRWQKLGWNILTTELPRQVFPDGVDFEGSIPYHRLVLELFLFPAFYRQACNLEVAAPYRERLLAMAKFTTAYSRSNGSVPLWGDADDARTLPFGDQPINDHRYLFGLVGIKWQITDLMLAFSGSRTEIYWYLGPTATSQLLNIDRNSYIPKSIAFPDGGFYIMRNQHDHVFIDCGPLGLAGRGGHGHNDCLALEAVLDGEHIISDCGAYLYTASYQERNNFRSTAYHNTPQIDGEEINRFIRWDYLWNLHYDAKPHVCQWETSEERDVFCGSHTGYQRLANPVSLKRTVTLNHKLHSLIIRDEFISNGKHQIQIPFHLTHTTTINQLSINTVQLQTKTKEFLFTWESKDNWQLEIERARISPSYGILTSSQKLILKTENLPASIITIYITPKSSHMSKS